MSKRAPKKIRTPGTPKAATPPSIPVVKAATEPERRASPRWLRLGVRVLEPMSVAGLLGFMLWVSWMRWGDPLIDFPRDLYMAWRISEGDKLYEKIANWYGPLAQLVEGAGFKIFGVGMDTMVWMNITVMVMVVLLLRAIFGLVGNRLLVWLISVVFIVAFGCEQFTLISNYNFITPYASQAVYTFAGLLVVIWGLLRHLKTERRRWLVVAGLGMAVAYLDKPEGTLAAAGAVIWYVLVRMIREARRTGKADDWRGAGRWAARAMGWMAAGFFGLMAPVFIYFLTKGSVGYALLATNFMPYTVIHAEVSGTVANSPQMQRFAGYDHLWTNFFRQLLTGTWLVVVCGAIGLAGWGQAQARKFGGGWWSCLALMAGAVGLGVWLGYQDNAWVGVGDSLAFPVMVATLVMAGLSVEAAWRGRTNYTEVLGVAVIGVAGSLMLYRIPLAARIGQYGFFMMPLATMFWMQIMTVEAPRWFARKDRRRTPWLPAAAFALLVLVGTGQLLRVDLAIYADKTFAVGTGRDRFYTFPINPAPGHIMATRGVMLNTMITAFKTRTPNAKTLNTFPEGIAVNYHLRVPTTLAELEFDPFALSFFGQEHVLDELSRKPPDAIFVFYRDLREFGANYFGESDSSGREILDWVMHDYQLVAKADSSPGTKTGDAMDLYVPKGQGGEPPSAGNKESASATRAMPKSGKTN